MPNRHVKTINGRKYYYESIRKGKKVTSRYLGPVERVRNPRRHAPAQAVAEEKLQEEFSAKAQIEEAPEDSYIG